MTTMIRVATAADTDTLLNSLLEAANWNGEVRKSRDDIRSSKYVVGYGFFREDIPEPTIGVASGARGNQIGTRLLDALMNLARERDCNGVSLSVEDGNPARRLYERSGFIKVGRNGNSDTLLLEFSAI